MEDSLLRILKRFMLIIIGSGLLSNALYIHGLAYYEGFIDRLGFEYEFFPLPSSDVLFWTYSASRELGASSIIAITEFKQPILLTILGCVYLLSRIWIESSNQSNKTKIAAPKKHKIKLFKKIYNFKLKHKIIFYTVYIPLRWLILKEQSLMAFVTSYFFMVFLFFIPFFLLIWVYFPVVGLEHGKSVAESRIDNYINNLCGNEEDYWNECIKIGTEHIQNYDTPSVINGRLILKSGDLLGIYTKEGAVVVTMPSTYYLKTTKNICYGGC